MLRLLVAMAMWIAFTPTICAGGRPVVGSGESADEIEKLNGIWTSPRMDFGPGITGHFQLKLEFKKANSTGRAIVLSFVSRNGVVVKPGPAWTAESKEKNKKHIIVLVESKNGKRAELAEIAYEVNGDKLKLKSSKTIRFEKDGNPIELSGDWQRNPTDK